MVNRTQSVLDLIDSNSELIKANHQLQSSLTIALDALKAIEGHEHQRSACFGVVYDDEYEKQLLLGQCDGHRCCAAIASAALAKIGEGK